MIIDKESTDNFFLAKCADWQCVTSASDESDAAATSIELANQKYNKNLRLSPTIDVINITNIINQSSDYHKVYTPDALADAGLYDLSAKYSKLIGFMKKDES